MTLKRSRSKKRMAVVAVGGQADLQLPEQGAAVGQPGQVVVEGDVLGPLLGVDARLELDEHGGDRLQGADLLGRPGVQSEVEEAQDPPGRVGQEAGARTRRRPAGTPEPFSTRSRYSSAFGRRHREVAARAGPCVAANTGSASKGTSPSGSGSGTSRGGHSASRMLRPRWWSLRRRKATSAPRNSASTRVVQVSTSWRVRDDADMSRSATWPTSSSRRRWSSRRLSRGGQGHGVAQQTAEGLGERTLPARPGPALAGHDEGADEGAVLQLDRLDQDAPGDARDDAGERADGGSAPSWLTTRLRMWTRACSEPGQRPRLCIEARYGLVQAADDVDDLRTGDDLSYRLDDETGLQAGDAGEMSVELS